MTSTGVTCPWSQTCSTAVHSATCGFCKRRLTGLRKRGCATGHFPSDQCLRSSRRDRDNSRVARRSTDDLEITVHRDTVTLRGERQDKSDDAGAYHRRERGSGTFVRTFGLPFQVDPDKVDAKLKDGILTLSLQRPEHDKPKRIRVSAS